LDRTGEEKDPDIKAELRKGKFGSRIKFVGTWNKTFVGKE
jgi:hypothetical protein